MKIQPSQVLWIFLLSCGTEKNMFLCPWKHGRRFCMLAYFLCAQKKETFTVSLLRELMRGCCMSWTHQFGVQARWLTACCECKGGVLAMHDKSKLLWPKNDVTKSNLCKMHMYGFDALCVLQVQYIAQQCHWSYPWGDGDMLWCGRCISSQRQRVTVFFWIFHSILRIMTVVFRNTHCVINYSGKYSKRKVNVDCAVKNLQNLKGENTLVPENHFYTEVSCVQKNPLILYPHNPKGKRPVHRFLVHTRKPTAVPTSETTRCRMGESKTALTH